MAVKNKHLADIISAVISYLLTWFIFSFFGGKTDFFIFILVMSAVFLAIKQLVKIRSRKIFTVSVLYAFIISASFIIGGKINIAEKTMSSLDASDAGNFIGLVLIFFITVSCIINFAAKHTLSNSNGNWGKRTYILFWILSSLILFLCWFPALLIYYPGNISADSLACIIRALGKAKLSNQQPVFYILLMRPFLLAGSRFKDLNFGLACFSFFQSAVFALIIGYALCRLKKTGAPLWSILFAETYFIFYPVFQMYSITLWKDVLFGAFILLYSLDIYEIVENKGNITLSAFIRLIVLSLLISFFRNNGIFIVAAASVILLIVYRKFLKRFAPALLAMIIFVFVIQGPVYAALGISPSPFAESVAIPLQQIGRTVKKDGKITDSQNKFIGKLLSEKEIKEAYNPLTADGIKFHKDFNNGFLETHKTEFLKTWAEMLKPNIKEYMKAYCLETVGYWHIGTNNWVIFNGVADAHDSRANNIVSLDLLDNKAGTDHFRKNLSGYYKSWTEQPVLSDMLNIGFLFWAAVLSAFSLVAKKGIRYLLPYLPLLLLWATLMIAAPTFCEYRYMLPFAMFLPFGIIIPFITSKTT